MPFHLVPARDDGPGQLGGLFQGLGGGGKSGLDGEFIQQLHDPGRARLQAIEIVALVGMIADRFAHRHAQFIHHLRAPVALGDVHFRALFHIDHDRKGDPGPVGQIPPLYWRHGGL